MKWNYKMYSCDEQELQNIKVEYLGTLVYTNDTRKLYVCTDIENITWVEILPYTYERELKKLKERIHSVYKRRFQL